MSKNQAEEKLMKARVALCLKAPYLANALLRLPLKPGPSWVETLATDGYRIFYNAGFINKMSDAQVRGTLCHELMHVLTDSLGRRNGRIPSLWNIACDYAINTILLDMGFTLPKGCLFSEEYRRLTSEEIYGRVCEDFKKNGGKIIRITLESDYPNGSSSQGGDSIGRLSAAVGDDMIYEGTPERESLPGPGPGEPNDKESIRIALGDIRKAFEDHCKEQGHFPGNLAEEFRIAKHPTVDWRALLQHWLIDRVKTDWNLFPPSKKFLWQGLYLPSIGAPCPCKIVFAVDTSGSMGDELLSTIYAEIRSFRDTFPSELTIIQADAEVTDIKEYGEYEDFENPEQCEVKGRGGTDFRPVFEWINKNCPEGPVIIVHATDGYGDFPEVCEHPIVWLLPKDHSDAIPDWGQKIVISEN